MESDRRSGGVRHSDGAEFDVSPMADVELARNVATAAESFIADTAGGWRAVKFLS